MPPRTKPIILRTSERKSFRRCPQQWWWAWRQGLVPIGSISDALWFGSGTHIALAAWYKGPGLKRGPHPSETFRKWAEGEIRFIKTSNKSGDGALSTTIDKLEPAMDLGVAMLENYVKVYGKDDSWHIIQPEQTFALDVPARRNAIRRVVGIYAGTYDLVYRDLVTDLIWLGEHKTARAIPADLGYLQLDDQAGGYWLTAGQYLRDAGLIGKRERLEGIMYNFLRKALPDDRPRNAEGLACNKPTKADYVAALTEHQHSASNHGKPWEKHTLPELEEWASDLGLEVLGAVSKVQPAPLFHREPIYRTARERKSQLTRLQDEMDAMALAREGLLPIFKNTTPECRFCPFHDMCKLHEAGGDWQSLKKALYRVQDPYADHRKSTEE